MEKRNLSYLLFALTLCSLLSIFPFLDNASLSAAAPPTPTPSARPRGPSLPMSGSRLLPPPNPQSQPWIAEPRAPLGAFGSDFVVNTDNATLHHEPAIAIDPLNANRILASSNNYSAGANAFYYLSTNGGTTWSEGSICCVSGGGDGWVAFDKLGHGFLVEGEPSGAYIGRLSATNSWEQAIQLATNAPLNAGGFAIDKPFVAVDQTSGPYANRVYAGWMEYINDTNSNVNWIILRYADANTWPTFSPVITVSPSFATVNSWTNIAVGVDSAVYVSYVTYYPPNKVNQYILVSKSMNGGVSFTQTYTISVSYPANWYAFQARSQLPGAISGGSPLYFIVNNGPMLVTHPTDPNKLAVVWMDGYACPTPATCTNAHIVSSYSMDGGATWSTPIVVNDDNDNGRRDHFFPALATGPDGTLHASWFDRRQTLNCANPFLYNEFYSYSTDWGQHWSRNVRVSSSSSDPGNPQYSPGYLFIGDFSGIAVAADNSIVMPAWTDARAGKQNIFSARAIPPVTAPSIVNNCTFFPLIFR